tara:strand:+ start:111 stop:818 length:708 start_codon:yes stop_codon:yes gene_type:complete
MSFNHDQNILVLDCALSGFSVAASRAGAGQDGYGLITQREQASLIVPAIMSVFERLELDPKALDAVFVTSGPGSFTGLRVGAATAQGYALAADCPVYSLSSLQLLAYAATKVEPDFNVYAACIKSKSDDLYFQIFDSYYQPIDKPSLIGFDRLYERMNGQSRVCFVGNVDKEMMQPLLSTVEETIFLLTDIVNEASLLGFASEIIKNSLEKDFDRLTYLREADISVGKKAVRKLK